MEGDLYRRAIARAAEILGGRQWLAVYLGVDAGQLKKWTTRGARPPLPVILAITQVLHHAVTTNYMRPWTRAPARRRSSRAGARRAVRRRGKQRQSAE